MQVTDIEFSGYKWQSGHRWGNYHPKNPTFWCDPLCVDVTNNVLRLQTKRHKISTTDAGVIDIGVGLVTSVDDFEYGKFEAEVMLPKGTGLFPAFWLYGADTWPPEIDIFEGWSRKSGLYTSKGIPYFSLASNVHYGNSNYTHKSIKSKSHMVWKRFDRQYIKFELDWYPDEIIIYYDNMIARRVTDPNVLEWFDDKKMQVVFNNGVDKPSEYTNDSVMLVKNFKYTPFF